MNLESKIYELSFELSEVIDKNDLQKLLGVLSNDGVYAMWVYAMDKLKEEAKKTKITDLIIKLDYFIKVKKESDNNKIHSQYFQNLAQDLNKLLFMKELLEKVFIYALYHAKAKGD
jgi:hypothetical protein